MKKVSIVIFIAFLLFCLASCNSSLSETSSEMQHEHTYELISNEYSHFTQYTCGCPSPDIAELHSDGNDDGKCDVCDFRLVFSLSSFEPWLNTASSDNVQQIKISKMMASDLNYHYYFNAKSAIDSILSTLNNVKLHIPEDSKSLIVPGMSSTIIQIIFEDGTEKKISFHASLYKMTYQTIEVFNFDYQTAQFKTNSVVTHSNSYVIYDTQNEIISSIDLDGYEFVKYSNDTDNLVLLGHIDHEEYNIYLYENAIIKIEFYGFEEFYKLAFDKVLI